MGTFRYGSPTQSFEFDDRTLAHLAVVIAAKLRGAEEFSFSFAGVEGSTTLWVSRDVPLRFDFDDSAQVSINRKWVLVLERAALTGHGLRVIPEPSIRPPLSAARPAAELAQAVRV